VFSLICLTGFIWPFYWSPPNLESYGSNAWVNREVQILRSNSNINSTVLRLSLTAYVRARQRGLDSKQLLTVIDFSEPSSQKRLWVFDLKRNRTLFNTWVSHGKNSGDISATSFSNQHGSLKSSIGVFVTDQSYVGLDGYSLHISGLEPGINDNAYRRNVVLHGASYVNADIIRKYGRVGRSWGCFAVNKQLSSSLINDIKNNTVVVAYYPDRYWLSHSRFIS
jgi:hypothetical protein